MLSSDLISFVAYIVMSRPPTLVCGFVYSTSGLCFQSMGAFGTGETTWTSSDRYMLASFGVGIA